MQKNDRRTFLKQACAFLAVISTTPFLHLFKRGDKDVRVSYKKARHYKELAG